MVVCNDKNHQLDQTNPPTTNPLYKTPPCKNMSANQISQGGVCLWLKKKKKKVLSKRQMWHLYHWYLTGILCMIAIDIANSGVFKFILFAVVKLNYTILDSHCFLDISHLKQFTEIWPQKCNKTSTKRGRGAEEFSQSPPPLEFLK